MDNLSPQTLSIRAAQPDDVIHLLRIQLDALRALCIHDYTPEQIEALVGRNIRYSSLGGSRREITLVAEVDSVKVGLCSLLGDRITAMNVHLQFARRSIGTQLLNAVERIARASQHQNSQEFCFSNFTTFLSSQWLSSWGRVLSSCRSRFTDSVY